MVSPVTRLSFIFFKFEKKMKWITLSCFLALLACKSSPREEQATPVSDSTVVATVDIPVFNPSVLSPATLPETLVYDGELENAYRWTDSLGDNIFFLSAKGPTVDNNRGESGDNERTSRLFGFHYRKKQEVDYRLIWSFSDVERSCPLDITADFLPGSVTITDLDGDGIAEIKFQYAMACRGDISPARMRLVLIEDGKEYSLKGWRFVEFGPDFIFNVDTSNVNLESLPPLEDGEDHLLRTYGRYESESKFRGAPPAFLSHAREEWIKFAIEKF